MVIRMGAEESNSGQRGSGISVNGQRVDADDVDKLLLNAIFRKIVWADVTDLVNWQTGGPSTHQLGTLIVNPPRNLFNFYFGAEGGGYLDALVKFVLGLAATLIFLYFIAVMFAAVLIYSI